MTSCLAVIPSYVSAENNACLWNRLGFTAGNTPVSLWQVRLILHRFRAKELTLAEAFAGTFSEYRAPGVIAIANSAVLPAPGHKVYDNKYNIIKIKCVGNGTIFDNRPFYVLDYRYVRALSNPGGLSFLAWVTSSPA